MAALKWGIASAGKISADFVQALKVLPDHKVIAVAARNLSNAESFAKLHNIEKFYEGYQKLAEDGEVEVIYIGVLNPQHYELCKLMLEHNKHVLCEKPFAMNLHQTKSILDLAKTKGLFIMEAVWSRCFPVYKKLPQIISSGAIGEVKLVQVNFGFNLKEVERLQKKELGGGATLDLGVYCLQFQQLVFHGLKPIKIVVNGHLNEEGTDDTVIAIITYPEGRTAIIGATASSVQTNEAVISGTKGLIKIPFFWSPTKIIVNDEVQEFPLIENDGKFNYLNSAGLAYEAEEVRKCIRSGKTECELITHEDTLELAQLMDTLRAGVGVVFDCDKQ